VKRPIVAIALSIVVLTAAAIAAADDSPPALNPYGQPASNRDLLRVLADIQKLDYGGILGLQVWASYSKPEPPSPILTPLDQVETDIVLKLSSTDRSAVLSWLNRGGRSKLYALGGSDVDIGPCVDLVDTGSCNAATSHGSGPTGAAAPSFRDLPFTFAPGSNEDGGIAIEHGFAIAKTDARSETHCLTFKNVGSKKADAVTFVYKIHAQSGAIIYAASNVRAGSFEPGAEVPGPDTAAVFAGIRSDGPDKALLANCWTKTTPLATSALLRAAYITVTVVSVTFDDGTHWALGQ
jgi:hypothetical protein